MSVITKTQCFWFIRHLESFHCSHFKKISGMKLKVTNVKYLLIKYCLHYMLLKSRRGLGLITNPFCNITKKYIRYYIFKNAVFWVFTTRSSTEFFPRIRGTRHLNFHGH
jgi:hypothetical protein